MGSKLEVEHEDEKWQRYRIEPKNVVIEQICIFKSLRLYGVGKEGLERVAALFNVEIAESGGCRWVQWKDGQTGVECVIFE